jgi:predicted Zn-dependent peptidase
MKYITKTLDNGLMIIISPMNNTQSISAGFFVKAGSQNETHDNRGVAHFLEHLVCGATKNRTSNQIEDELHTINAKLNASTDNYYTEYHINGSANDAKKIIDILMDMYLNPLFTTKHVEDEKKIIIEEYKNKNGAGVGLIIDVMYSGTSASVPVIGTLETINFMSLHDIVNFHNQHYNPNNTIFVVTGNINAELILNFLESGLEKKKNNDIKFVDIVSIEKNNILNNMLDLQSPRFYINANKMQKMEDNAHVYITFPLFETSYDDVVLSFVINLLTDMGSKSIAHDELRNVNKMVYQVKSLCDTFCGCTIYTITTHFSSENLQNGIQLIFKILKDLKMGNFNSDKITYIVNDYTQYKKNQDENNDSYDRMSYLGHRFIHDKNSDLNTEKLIKKYADITKQQIVDFANKFFVVRKMNMFVFGPAYINNISYAVDF